MLFKIYKTEGHMKRHFKTKHDINLAYEIIEYADMMHVMMD